MSISAARGEGASRAAPPDVAVAGLTKSFGRGADALAALSAIDITLRPGSTTALVGPSGCGKSTLLRIVAGLEIPSTGTVAIGGEPPQAIAARGELAVAFQDASLLPWRTAEENVALARQLARQTRDPALVADLLARVGLEGFERARPAEMSGGMRQRCAIARCLASGPRLLLLDEPFGAVDELTRRRLNLDLPRVWEDRGTTTLLVTHSVTEAVLLSDRVLVMSARPGRIVDDIAVRLARPRRAGVIDTPEFHHYVGKVTAALGIEAEA